MTTRGEWLEAYRRAWEAGDTESALALFTEDVVYRSSPFREPSVGHAGLRQYWDGATGDQVGVEVVLGEPVEEGDRVAVEWWTTMREEGEEVTLPGCLVLRFAPDGRCEELREYWHLERGRREPPTGWGA
ncbi:MAG TPA: nuclear transport factor 2 family protein [Gaiellaceae bacterium]